MSKSTHKSALGATDRNPTHFNTATGAAPTVRDPDQRAVQPSSEARDRVRRMLQDLDVPLDSAPDRSATPGRAGSAPSRFRFTGTGRSRSASNPDLRRARRAARKVFKVNPSRSARQRATAMLTAGAVGLAAFTGPSAVRGFGESETGQMLGSDDPTQNRIHASRIATSERFKRALIQEEGVRQVVYRDVAGYPTVGVGHLVKPQDNLRLGDRISSDRVLGFLERDIAEAEGHVRDLIGGLPLFQHEFDALVDLVYNVGRGNVSASQSPRLNAAIDAGDYERIASELNYTHAAGRVARGLEFRSERRESIFVDASYVDPREAAAPRSRTPRSDA